MARAMNKCYLFFQALKGKKMLEWNKKYEEAFQRQNTYLENPPLLSKPICGEILYVYLAVFDKAVSAVLVC